jgi:hypothetical protein
MNGYIMAIRDDNYTLTNTSNNKVFDVLVANNFNLQNTLKGESITLFTNYISEPFPFIAPDGKIDARILRDGDGGCGDGCVINQAPARLWDCTFKNKSIVTSLVIDNTIVEEVKLSALPNLSTVEIYHSRVRYFELMNSKIEEIDFRNFNANDYLEEVVLANNPLLRKIIINSNPENRKPLKSISFIECPNLEEIYIDGCQVNAINVRNNTKLRILHAENNQTVSVVCQRTSGAPPGYGDVGEKVADYYLKDNGMLEHNFNSMFRTLDDSFEFIVLRIGNTSYSRRSDILIATERGHIVIFG